MAKRTSCTCIPTCTMNFCYDKESSVKLPPSSATTVGCGVLSKKLLSGVTAAFFASLERCSCINIATKDDTDDGDYLPLILADGRSGGDQMTGEDHKDEAAPVTLN